MNSLQRSMVIGVIVIGAGGVLAAQSPRPAASNESRGFEEELPHRLARLSPDDPIGYFELAEEVAYEVPGSAGRDLARKLFVLSFELSRRVRGGPDLARSACLALADLATDPADRAWLLSLSGMVASELDVLYSHPVHQVDDNSEAMFRMAEMLGRYRSNAMREVREALRRDDIQQMLERHASRLQEAGFTVEAAERALSCEGCRNRRVVRTGADTAMCPICKGNPGTELSADEWVAQLVLEAELLRVEHRSWSAQLIQDGGEPVRDLDPDELVLWFDVDPMRPIWREGADGGWRSGAWVPAMQQDPP